MARSPDPSSKTLRLKQVEWCLQTLGMLDWGEPLATRTKGSKISFFSTGDESMMRKLEARFRLKNNTNQRLIPESFKQKSIWMFPKNRGTPKSSILIGFSIINHPFWGSSIFGNTHMSTFLFKQICLQPAEPKSSRLKKTGIIWVVPLPRMQSSPPGLFCF